MAHEEIRTVAYRTAARTCDHYDRLSALASDVLAGYDYECAWELFRFGHFRGMDDGQSATVLVRWARAHRINAAFKILKVRNLEVLYLCLSSSTVTATVNTPRL
jgi:hypothetical protein